MTYITKTDESSEKFQTAFDPPLIFGKLCCKLFKLATKPSQVAGTLYFLKALGTAFFKMYPVLIFNNTIVEKHNLKRPLCIIFMVK